MASTVLWFSELRKLAVRAQRFELSQRAHPRHGRLCHGRRAVRGAPVAAPCQPRRWRRPGCGPDWWRFRASCSACTGRRMCWLRCAWAPSFRCCSAWRSMGVGRAQPGSASAAFVRQRTDRSGGLEQRWRMKNLFNVFRRAAVVLSMPISALSPAATQVSIGDFDARREHRHQPAGVPGVRARAELPRVLRAAAAARTSSSTTACTGSTSRTTGTRVPGTTGRGTRVAPQAVPLFVLRIPVRYYRNPPTYFRGWRRRRAAALGRSLGQSLVAAAKRMGPLGPPRCAGARAAADLPAAVLGRSLSAGRAGAAHAAEPQLPRAEATSRDQAHGTHTYAEWPYR